MTTTSPTILRLQPAAVPVSIAFTADALADLSERLAVITGEVDINIPHVLEDPAGAIRRVAFIMADVRSPVDIALACGGVLVPREATPADIARLAESAYDMSAEVDDHAERWATASAELRAAFAEIVVFWLSPDDAERHYSPGSRAARRHVRELAAAIGVRAPS